MDRELPTIVPTELPTIVPTLQRGNASLGRFASLNPESNFSGCVIV